MNRKNLTFILVGWVLVWSNVGCFNDKEEKSKVIGMILSSLSGNQFMISLKEGAEEEAHRIGYDVIALDSQDSSIRELTNVVELLSKGVACLIINPTDRDAVISAIKTANQAGVPVITVDREAGGGKVVTHVVPDNVEGGKMAGRFLGDLLEGKGKVVELQGSPGASSARDRGIGFHDAMMEFEGIEIVEQREAGFNRNRAVIVMSKILQEQPVIHAVFAHNDRMALGAIDAIEGAHRQGILVVGFDASEEAIIAIGKGRLTATIEQQPELMGSLSVRYAISHLEGKKIPPLVSTRIKLLKQ